MPESNDLAGLRDAIIRITAAATGRRLKSGAETTRREFTSLGVDSVNVFEIILQLEERYGITLDDKFLFDYRTPDAAAEALGAMLNQRGTAAAEANARPTEKCEGL